MIRWRAVVEGVRVARLRRTFWRWQRRLTGPWGRVAGVVLVAFLAVQLARHQSSGGVAGLPTCGELDARIEATTNVSREAREAFRAECEKHGWTMVPEATPTPKHPG
jgi:hypothetical protein